MDFDRKWTRLAVDAEVDSFGTARLCAAHNAMRAELEMLRVIADAAVCSVRNPAWAGVCDEDVDLERALRSANMLPPDYRS